MFNQYGASSSDSFGSPRASTSATTATAAATATSSRGIVMHDDLPRIHPELHPKATCDNSKDFDKTYAELNTLLDKKALIRAAKEKLQAKRSAHYADFQASVESGAINAIDVPLMQAYAETFKAEADILVQKELSLNSDVNQLIAILTILNNREALNQELSPERAPTPLQINTLAAPLPRLAEEHISPERESVSRQRLSVDTSSGRTFSSEDNTAIKQPAKHSF